MVGGNRVDGSALRVKEPYRQQGVVGEWCAAVGGAGQQVAAGIVEVAGLGESDPGGGERVVGVDPLASAWTLHSLLFTATGSTTRLGFWSLNGANGTVFGPMLDGVSVERVASVPEPGTLALIGLGLGVLGLARRRS